MLDMVAVGHKMRLCGFKKDQNFRPDGNLSKIMDLNTMLSMVHSTKAYHFTYILAHPEEFDFLPKNHQFRMVISNMFEAYTTMFVADIDRQPHVPWTESEIAEIKLGRMKPKIMPTEGYCFTSGGIHIYQPLAEPIPIAEATGCHMAWLQEKIRMGIPVDLRAGGWWRSWKVPSYRDGEKLYIPYEQDFSHMAPIVWDRARTTTGRVNRLIGSGKKPSVRIQVPRNLKFSTDLPEEYKPIGDRIAEVIKEDPPEVSWHKFHVDLAGHFCYSMQIPYELIPAMNLYIAQKTGADDDLADRYRCGEDTVLKYRNGHDFLRRTVSDSVKGAIEGKQVIKAANAIADAKDKIRKLPLGLTLLDAPCGTGKTWMVIDVAIERAEKGQKTFIAVDKNSLARQIQDYIAERGHSAMRLYGPLSVKDKHGKPVCRMASVAKHIADGGMSIRETLCKNGCPYADSCSAKEEDFGDTSSKIILTVHDLLPTVIGMAGVKDYLIIDELPSMVEYAEPMSAESDVFGMLSGGDDYKRTMRQAVLCADASIALGQDEFNFPESLVEDVKQIERSVPNVSLMKIAQVRESAELSEKVGKAARYISFIHRIITQGVKYKILHGEDGDPDKLMIFNRKTHAAVMRKGANLIMSADIGNYLKPLSIMYGGQPGFIDIKAEDGARIVRTMLRSNAKKTDAVIGTHVHLTERIADTWSDAIGHIVNNKAISKVGIISNKLISLHFYRALKKMDFFNRVVPNRDYDGEVMDEEMLMRIICRMSNSFEMLVKNRAEHSIFFGHYYAMKGLDLMKGCDAVITIGDPWPNVLAAKHEMSIEGEVSDEEFSRRFKMLVAAELNQCLGRLRTPHRKVIGYQYHVGIVRPSGYGWDSCEVLDLERGPRLPDDEVMGLVSKAIERAGSAKKLADIVGESKSNISRWASGKRRPGVAVLGVLEGFLLEPKNASPEG